MLGPPLLICKAGGAQGTAHGCDCGNLLQYRPLVGGRMRARLCARLHGAYAGCRHCYWRVSWPIAPTQAPTQRLLPDLAPTEQMQKPCWVCSAWAAGTPAATAVRHTVAYEKNMKISPPSTHLRLQPHSRAAADVDGANALPRGGWDVESTRSGAAPGHSRGRHADCSQGC